MILAGAADVELPGGSGIRVLRGSGAAIRTGNSDILQDAVPVEGTSGQAFC